MVCPAGFCVCFIPKFSSAQFLVGHLILAFGGNGMVNLRNLSVVSV
jgi:hypothetical protein